MTEICTPELYVPLAVPDTVPPEPAETVRAYPPPTKFAVSITSLLGIEKLHGLLVPHEYPDPPQLANWYPEAAFAVTMTAVPAGYDPLMPPPEKDDPPTVPEIEYPPVPKPIVSV